ncbi:MAG: hypothetical protein PHR96_02470 [Clostridia bacterium]|nr:hypothetical protein [Clostridia bacterium]
MLAKRAKRAGVSRASGQVDSLAGKATVNWTLQLNQTGNLTKSNGQVNHLRVF